MKKTIKINKYDIIPLERDMYQIRELKHLIAFMIQHNLTTLPNYERYNKELRGVIEQYEIDKTEFQDGFIKSLLNSREKLTE